jgi:hypothetical protein
VAAKVTQGKKLSRFAKLSERANNRIVRNTDTSDNNLHYKSLTDRLKGESASV